MSELLAKGRFAERIGVSPGRISQMIAEGKIGPEAIEGEGPRAKIRVDVALAHLKQRLDPNQRFGLNGITTRLDAPVQASNSQQAEEARPTVAASSAPTDLAPIDPVEERIKREKLRQAELVTAKLEREDRAAHGAYVRTEAAREEMTRIAATLLTIFEGALPDLSGALAAQFGISGRDALHLLRQELRKIRERAAAAHRDAAVAMPETEEDDQATTD
jgi:hypothetical protein